MKYKDLTGQQFGRWTALEPISTGNGVNWVVRCDCGTTNVVEGKSLRNGRSKICGCLKKDLLSAVMQSRATRHGYSKSRTYQIWNTMVQRCHNQKAINYRQYGGAGITVCQKWRTFSGFLEDMGEAIPPLTIDRINNSAGYCKENCRWVSRAEQNRNKSNNKLITANGKTLLISDWARILGIDIRTLWNRFSSGWSHDEIVNKPLRKIAKSKSLECHL